MLAPGATRNPHDPGRTPGGSSSGSAAAVAAGFCPLAIGTQTVGSTIRPAAFCGVVGFKPSFGRVPLDGVVPVSPSADTIGLFTQDVVGMELAAAALIEGWEPATVDGPPRLAVPDGPYVAEAKAVARRPLKGLRRVDAFDWESVYEAHWNVVLAEFAASHAEWFPRYASLYRPGTANLLERGRAIDAAALEAGRASMTALRARLHARMDEEGIDVWASPATRGKAPKGQDATGSPALNLPWSHAGLPTLTIPARPARDGMPIGLQLSARFGDDEKLLAWARYLLRGGNA
jgi:Asp-tRNA(Asn)/Glu-tRNA(Gln) amidotransferase A subunit family amidase